ncbi:MetQ/NlpA family ABC transporter substrate-binding protein [Columbia Basin potato purple top phytoplasma]|uniref:Uncharacterized protein n=1 Tax=Columbia Basin potato purple top phytoplasma TaxID=307134 RepID=A0ABT5L959_9MOLU|nr:MetQ/NlpA family ABC transporter substrate-binding protein [Columbia Basin potato purple top phytoplasma]MDC9032143.1 hypothetical protein [Columbia Basin potato purple top phytoplasma]
MFWDKIKRKKLFISFLILFCFTVICGLFYFGKTKSNTFKIATALPSIKDFLNSPTIKGELKKQGYDVEIISLSDFAQHNRLLKNDEVIATLDSHLPYVYFLNQNDSPFQFVVVQPVYWANIGLYNVKQERSNRYKIRDSEELGSVIKEIKNDRQKKPIRILICNEPHQMNISLRFLEKLKIIKRKSHHEDKDTNIKDKNFQLNEDDFDTLPVIQICKSTDQSPKALSAMVLEFKDQKNNIDDEYDLFINYPAIAGVQTGQVDVIETLKKPEKDDYNIAYTISLITKKENEKNDFIIKLKEILNKEESIKELQSKITGSVIPKDEKEAIANFINSKFS